MVHILIRSDVLIMDFCNVLSLDLDDLAYANIDFTHFQLIDLCLFRVMASNEHF